MDQAPQLYSWTCSSASLDWVMRSTGIAPDYGRYRSAMEIGYPEQINAEQGLTNVNGPGQALQDVLAQYGEDSAQAWLSFEEVFERTQTNTGMIAGVRWYHWVALRGTMGGHLWIANSAPGYKGIWDLLSRADFERLGPFNTIFLTR